MSLSTLAHWISVHIISLSAAIFSVMEAQIPKHSLTIAYINGLKLVNFLSIAEMTQVLSPSVDTAATLSGITLAT